MVDASKVRVAVTGAVMKGLTSAAAPTGTSGSTTGFVDLGYIGEDGVEIELPDAGDATPIKAWQNGTTVRTIRTPSEDLPSWTFTLLETTIATVETYFGVTVTSSSTEGSFQYKVANRGYNSYIVDVVDGTELLRDYIPKGIVTSVASHTFANGEPIGFQVTIEAELNTAGTFNFQRFATALKT
ncbi:MAG: phage portal protein [Sphingomonadales bacterium]|nr:phage portal protein [Sphingomonadales bacterium]